MKILIVNESLLYHMITIKRVRGQVMLNLRVCVCTYVYARIMYILYTIGRDIVGCKDQDR